MDILHAHGLAFGRLSSHSLNLRGTRLLKSGTIGAGTNKTFSSLFLMKAEVVDQLFLDLEGLATFFTLVSTKGTDTNQTLLRESIYKW